MKNTKLVSIILSVIMCFGILGGAFSASADENYVSVHLTKNQSSASSDNVYGTYKYYWGSNSTSSSRVVLFTTRYKSGGVWKTDENYRMFVGESIPSSQERRTQKFDTERYWFLRLNPEGSGTKGCEAWGYMRNK